MSSLVMLSHDHTFWLALMVDAAGAPALAAAAERELIEALRKLDGRGTLGDVVRATGLPRDQTEQDLRALLGLYRSHLEVDEGGELLYLFDPSFERRIPKDQLSDTLRAMARWSWKAFVVLFKISVMGILVFYVMAFCLLLIAAFVAMLSLGEGVDGDGIGDGIGEGLSGGAFDSISFWNTGDIVYVPYMIGDFGAAAASAPSLRVGHSAFSEPHALDPRYVTDTVKARRSRKNRFYEDVFAFVFGPTVPDPPSVADERDLLAWIESHRGVITLTELITRTGMSVQDAQQEMTRLLVRFGGDVEVSPEGQLLYTFQGLRVTAQQEGKLTWTPQPASPTWHRFEPDPLLTGNSGGKNALIGAMVAFTMAMSLVAPFIMAGLVGPGALVLLPLISLIPLALSLGFFLIPAGRHIFDVSPRRSARRARNIRRALLLVIFEHIAQSSHEPLTRGKIHTLARSVLKSLEEAKVGQMKGERRVMEGLAEVTHAALDAELDRVLAEFNAEQDVDEHGKVSVRFPEQLAELAAADHARGLTAAQPAPLAEIVFSTADEDDDPLRDQIDDLSADDLSELDALLADSPARETLPAESQEAQVEQASSSSRKRR